MQVWWRCNSDALTQAGDLISEVNREKVANLDQLKSALAKSSDQNRVLLLVNPPMYSIQRSAQSNR